MTVLSKLRLDEGVSRFSFYVKNWSPEGILNPKAPNIPEELSE
jgi:hypothetical protein